MKYLYSLLALFAFSHVFSQNCAPPTANEEFNANNISLIINSGEVQFTDVQFTGPGFEVPAGSGVHSLFASNFWIGGVAEDEQLKIAAGTYAAGQTDYYNGPLTLDGTAEVTPETCEEYNQLVTVCEYESLRHIEYFDCLNDPDCELSESFINGYTTPEAFNSYPAQGDTNLGQDFSLAPFYDYNEDGIYSPEDGDCPMFISMSDDIECTDCNALAGHKATFWITNDTGGPHTETNSLPVGVEIHNVIYAYSSTNYLNDVVFYQKKIFNRSSSTLTDTYLGTWTDTDIGNSNDDVLGCDIDRNIAFAYNGDMVDEASFGSPGYDEFPPALGLKFLNGVTNDILENDELLLTNFTSLNSGPGPLGDAQTPLQYYNFMRSTGLNGLPYVVPGTETSTNWMFAGDTYEDNSLSWFDDFPNDKKFLSSTGPFTFNSGDKECITNAYIYARSDSEEYSSLDKMLDTSDSVQVAFDDCFNCIPPLADIQLSLVDDFSFDFYNLSTGDNYLWDFGDGTSSSSIVGSKIFEPNQEYDITLTISNACGSDTDTISLSFGPLDISEQSEQLNLTLFPNPTSDQVTLSSEKTILLDIQLFDATGKQVLTLNTSSNSTIDLSELQSGHYILNASDKDKEILIKEQLILLN